MVYNKHTVLNHKAGSVAMTVGACVGFVGRYAIVCQKLRVAKAVNDDASAGAFHVGGDVEPAADEVEFLILHSVGVNRDGRR